MRNCVNCGNRVDEVCTEPKCQQSYAYWKFRGDKHYDDIKESLIRFWEDEVHMEDDIDRKAYNIDDDEQPPMKADIHYDICTELNDIYIRKNSDYGDSFAQMRNRLPNAILVRLFDKYMRLETLLNGVEQKVKSESIDDTLMDMANYCIMELVERRLQHEEQNAD